MIAKKIDQSRALFKPFKLEIEIETEDDIRKLYHIFNYTNRALGSEESKKYPHNHSIEFTMDLWNILDRELERINGK
jgi:hypothetical protein